jgi:hypothetical protein
LGAGFGGVDWRGWVAVRLAWVVDKSLILGTVWDGICLFAIRGIYSLLPSTIIIH